MKGTNGTKLTKQKNKQTEELSSYVLLLFIEHICLLTFLLSPLLLLLAQSNLDGSG